jgi:hypothetical protein
MSTSSTQIHWGDIRWARRTKPSNTTRTALTLYASAKSPGPDKESNWLPAPNGTFSLYIRAYWADKAVLDGTWQPPAVAMVK